jgi:hypothetical protein
VKVLIKLAELELAELELAGLELAILKLEILGTIFSLEALPEILNQKVCPNPLVPNSW